MGEWFSSDNMERQNSRDDGRSMKRVPSSVFHSLVYAATAFRYKRAFSIGNPRSLRMSSSEALLLAFLISVIAGLRAMTAPAVVAYAAHRGWLNLTGTHLSWMGATWALILFVLLAIVELITDQLPSTPPRTKGPGLIARILLGGLAGACVAVAGASSLVLGAILGIVGAVAGAFGGYQARTRLVRGLKVPDFVIGWAEDLVAICRGLLL